jgi:hypothetical protein
MTRANESSDDGYFMLSAWCTTAKAWHGHEGQYESSWQAQAAATERGIYRVSYLRDGRRLDMEPFAIVGDS